MIRLVDVLMRTETWFRRKGIASPRLEAELLLGHVLGVKRLQLYLMHDRPLGEGELEKLRPLVQRRGSREPLSWILGHREFHAIDLEIRPGVLDPRPDTETLVDAVLAKIPEQREEPVYVADIGCGSGAIGLALAHARPCVRLYAVDVDETALALTKANIERLGLSQRAGVLRGDLLDAVPVKRPVDWVVSNPPYIPTGEIDGLMPEVAQHEPRRALDGGRDGLDVYRRLVPMAGARARVGLAVEVGHDQAARVMDLFRRSGLQELQTAADLGGIDRVVLGRVASS
ncbi:MAG: peptide chain release factor N(5)-glutamine methyltransferase [Myxococcota bacterium]